MVQVDAVADIGSDESRGSRRHDRRARLG
jgi:hypothetical protein